MEWTFANLDGEWVNDSFETENQAIREGKLHFEESFLVGQLIGNDTLPSYKVENITEISL